MKSQRGSAIIWILIAVALFAALTYAFNSTSRTSVSFLTDAQAEAYADEIIAYGNEVKTAIKRVVLRGCDEDEVSFENNVVAGYNNPNSPVGNRCHIFESAGGGLIWKNTSNNINDGSPYLFMGNVTIVNIGENSASELLFILPKVNQRICEALNKKHNILPTNPLAGLNTLTITKFTGTYPVEDNLGTINVMHAGKKSFCFTEGATGDLFYINVLSAR